jgi:hypothetical protein
MFNDVEERGLRERERDALTRSDHCAAVALVPTMTNLEFCFYFNFFNQYLRNNLHQKLFSNLTSYDLGRSRVNTHDTIKLHGAKQLEQMT